MALQFFGKFLSVPGSKQFHFVNQRMNLPTVISEMDIGVLSLLSVPYERMNGGMKIFARVFSSTTLFRDWEEDLLDNPREASLAKHSSLRPPMPSLSS